MNGLLEDEPRNPGLRNLKAAVLGRIGDHEESIALYRAVLREYPHQPKVWMSLGHALKTAGQQRREHRGLPDAASSSRRSSARPGGASPTSRPSASRRKTSAAMRAQLAARRSHQRRPLPFPLLARQGAGGRGRVRGLVRALRAGQRACAASCIRYDADETPTHVRRSKRLFTREFFAERAGLGLPGARSDLRGGLAPLGLDALEQILASHSQVEGTQELPDISMIARAVGERTSRAATAARIREALGEVFAAKNCARSGEQYLAQHPHPAQDSTRRSSSTRCRTTSRTWDSST